MVANIQRIAYNELIVECLGGISSCTKAHGVIFPARGQRKQLH